MVGLAGVFATHWAGKKLPKTRKFNRIAQFDLNYSSMVSIIFRPKSLILYASGVILAYFGLSALHVLNQNLVYRISLQARSRINSIYMTLYFAGAALGSLMAVYAWKHWGWTACASIGLGMAILSFMIDRYDFYIMKRSADCD